MHSPYVDISFDDAWKITKVVGNMELETIQVVLRSYAATLPEG